MTLPQSSKIAATCARYLAAWSARDPDAIISQHASDTQFWLHSGEGPVTGKEAVREAFAALFEQWPDCDFEVYRHIHGENHWVLDYAMTATLTDPEGVRQPVRIDCVDVVTVDAKGLVARKDTFVDVAHAMALAGEAALAAGYPA